MTRTTRSLAVCASLAALLLGGTTAAAAAPKTSTISMEKADSIALARVPGGVVRESERDTEGTRVIYEIEVRAPDGRDHEFEIDGADGRIISEELDD